MDQETLINLITNEILRQIKNIEAAETADAAVPRLLVAFSGGSIGFKQSLSELESLSREFQLQLVLTKSAAEIYQNHQSLKKLSSLPVVQDADSVCMNQLLENIKGVVIPVLTFNSLAKIAAGISDTLFLNIIIHSLIHGIPVVAAGNAADLKDPERIKISGDRCSPGLLQLARENISKIKKLGIKVTDAGSLASEIRKLVFPKNGGPVGPLPDRKRIITQMDISPEVITAKTLMVPYGSILTPLVQDMIKTHGIMVMEK